MNKKILILGGGVAGCSCAYFLMKKGYKVTILEKEDYLGGLSATHYYNGHPYEFGPHVWFWPNDDINDVIRELTNNELYEVDRKLYTFTGTDLYRYPPHFSDIQNMSDKEDILKELSLTRDEDLRLKSELLPVLGQCTFEEYFESAIGKILYKRFMKDYTHKMWGIPGNLLQTYMVWADRIKENYTGQMNAYDPIKFKESFLGQGQPNWYPKKGWNIVWNGMAKGAEILYGHKLSYIFDGKILTNKGSFKADEYEYVINTLHSDTLFDEYELPANGRLIIPFLIPGKNLVFPDGAESIHYSDNIALTRTTEMKIITRHESPDTLICLEVPVTNESKDAFPSNINISKHYHPRCYNWQTKDAIEFHEYYVDKAVKKFPNILFCGRHANFKYWGMPEVVDAANILCKIL